MKRWIHAVAKANPIRACKIKASKSEPWLTPIDLTTLEILSLTVTDDIDDYLPRFRDVYAGKGIDYTKLNHDQLMDLPKRTREHLRDIAILRKLDYTELTDMQRMIVKQANETEVVSLTISQVREALQKLKECHRYYIWGTDKNETFADQIYAKGGEVTAKDARKIMHSLHVSDYSYAKYSYVSEDWNSLLMIFGYSGDYTFEANEEENGQPVTVSGLKLYIKIDMDKETNRGRGVLSFHAPDGKMTFPYENYSADKE